MKRFLLRTWGVVLVMFLCGVVAHAAPAESQEGAAQGEAAKAQDELPFGDLFSAEETGKNFNANQFTPYGNSRFTFQILVPKGWEAHLSEIDPDQLAHDTEGPVPMVDLAPSGVDDVGANVLYMRVPGQGPLDKFLDNYAKQAGGTIATRQKLELKGRAFEDALLHTNDDSLGPMLTRATVFRQGDLIYIFTGWGVEEKYEKYKRVFGAVLASFNPIGN